MNRRLPQNKIGTYNKANKALWLLSRSTNASLQPKNLGQNWGCRNERNRNQQHFLEQRSPHLLDAPVHEAEDVAMGDLLEGSDDTDDDVMKDSLRNEIRRA